MKKLETKKEYVIKMLEAGWVNDVQFNGQVVNSFIPPLQEPIFKIKKIKIYPT